MPRHIVHSDGWFFEWSTVVDAPYGYGGRREDFERDYRTRHPDEDFAGLAARLDRAVEHGTDVPDRIVSAEALVEGEDAPNSAGYDETYLPLAEIVRVYCVEQRDPRKGEGGERPGNRL